MCLNFSENNRLFWFSGQLATAMRRNPYEVHMLIGGYDGETKGPSLYFMDYMASLAKVDKAAHGYCSYFILRYLAFHTSIEYCFEFCFIISDVESQYHGQVLEEGYELGRRPRIGQEGMPFFSFLMSLVALISHFSLYRSVHPRHPHSFHGQHAVLYHQNRRQERCTRAGIARFRQTRSVVSSHSLELINNKFISNL
jgi:hypothetical protein